MSSLSINGNIIIYDGKIIHKKKPDYSDIKPGDKLRIYDDEMYIDKRSGIYRKISGDNRYKTLEFLNKQNLERTLHNKIIDCLKVTYKNDHTFVDTLTKSQKQKPTPEFSNLCNLRDFNITGGMSISNDLYIGPNFYDNNMVSEIE